ncbi:hypothetical protein [Streptomyces pinistramenti]|uniref:hypothetical protein n=1 Tax=Streptomyces pinistramenti TaxID=2884812 RepID=UPI001D076709|nr:hypothetical protein [Streptomyces pinistramenti]MCB5909677.1 hypothetical protein [Streptomyces pinistramenti]
MGDISAATWTTSIDGQPVHVPATMDGIPATLDPSDVDTYAPEVRQTRPRTLYRVLARWAMSAQAADEDDAIVARFKAGDFSGSGAA